MSKILGLDLGTNSIGWAVVDNNGGQLRYYKHENDPKTPTKGVIIFPEGVNIDDKTRKVKSRAGIRTDHRGARRLKFRRKIRKYQTLLVLADNGMCPLTVDEVERWRKSNFKKYPDKQEFLDWLRTDNFGEKDNEEHKSIRRKQNNNPYFFRDKYSRDKYDWQNNQEAAYELGRALYHMAQRRGFKSNRLEQSDENIIEEFKEKTLELVEAKENPVDLKNAVDELFEDFLDTEIKKGIQVKKFKDDELDGTGKALRKIWNVVNDTLQGKKKIKDKDGNDKELKTFAEQKTYLIERLNKPEYLGKVKRSIKELTKKIEDAGCKTLGQYYWHLYQENRHNIENKIRTNYTDREEHYLKEFDLICQVQKINSIDEAYTLKNPSKRYEKGSLASAFYKAIFYQRPLKSQKGLVGNCTFERNKPRCPISRPEFEEYRMWQFINNIKLKSPGDEQLRVLNDEEKQKVVAKFYREKTSFKFEEIATALTPKGKNVVYYKEREAKTADYVINYKLNTSVSGCPVTQKLKNSLGDKYDKVYKTQIHTLENCKQIKMPITFAKIAWHALFTYDDPEKLKEFAKDKLGLDNNKADKFSKISIEQGYANLSLKAINKILVYLRKGLIYDKAVFMANIENVVADGIWENHKEDIEEGIGTIIDKQQDEKKKTEAVNNLIADCRKGDDEGRPCTDSEEAKSEYCKDIEKQLKSVFGDKTWAEKQNKDQILEDAFSLFLKQLKKNEWKGGEFAKLKRLDEKVKEFLLGANPDGMVYCSNEEKLNKNLYHPSDLETFQPVIAKDPKGNPVILNNKEVKILPLPKSDAIKNPTLMRAMHQLRRLINELLLNGIIDEKTAIHVELARETNSMNERKAIEKWQEEQEKNKIDAINEIKNLYLDECKKDIQPNENDILRYLLWKEQERRTIYEDECTQISICDIIGTDPKYDIEHTLPLSRSWDNSMANKTLCSKAFNRARKSNKTPYELGKEKQEEILQRIAHWKEGYEKLDKEIKNSKPSRIQDEHKRNKAIQEKRINMYKRDYWKDKYERFTMEEIPSGFKNSQKSDTGLITRFAREYLGCVFKNQNENPNIFVVNGQMVDVFRKAWGVNKTITNQDGIEKKDRSNHIHHCIDAVTIACMTRDRFNIMVEAWKAKDGSKKAAVKEIIKKSIPWHKFADDVRNKLENEILIVHAHKDNMPKQSKKKLRITGKIQYKVDYKKDANGNYLKDKKGKRIIEKTYYLEDINGNKIPVPGKRDKNNPDFTLHKFKDPETKEIQYQVFAGKKDVERSENTLTVIHAKYISAGKTGNIVYMKQPIYLKGDTARGQLHQDTYYGAIKQPELDDNGKPKHTKNGAFILQKDKKGKDKITYVVRKELKKLKKDDVNKIIDNDVKEIIKQAQRDSVIRFNKNGAMLKDKIWRNKEKGIEIKKVRIEAHLAEPLPEFKKHKDIKQNEESEPKHPHKKWYYVQNAGNYGLAFYESKDRRKRDIQAIRTIEAADYYKISNHKHQLQYPIAEPLKNGLPFKTILSPNVLVIFYKENPEEIWDLEQDDKRKRLYRIRKTSKDGRITFQFHQEARTDDQLKIDYKKKTGNEPPKSLTNGVSSIDFDRLPIPKLLLSPVNMRMLIEGIDFKITPTGKIEKL